MPAEHADAVHEPYPTVSDIIGGTPMVQLQRLAPATATVLAKLEGANPAGSVKDRPAFAMIDAALRDGLIRAGDTVIEATSGNTGIALAAAAAALDVNMVIVIPAGSSTERLDAVRAYGAELIETDKRGGMELARDEAERIAHDRNAFQIDQFSNPANPAIHATTTAHEIWEQSHERVTHVVATMGTTGTVTGMAREFASLAPHVQVIGVQPAPGDSVPGIRAWPPEYLPRIFDPTHIAEVRHITSARAIDMTRRLARKEGLLLGPSSGGAAAIALDVATENPGSVVTFIAPDRGDRYLSTGIFTPDAPDATDTPDGDAAQPG